MSLSEQVKQLELDVEMYKKCNARQAESLRLSAGWAKEREKTIKKLEAELALKNDLILKHGPYMQGLYNLATDGIINRCLDLTRALGEEGRFGEAIAVLTVLDKVLAC